MRGLSSLEKTVGAYKPVNKWLLYAGPHRQLLDKSVLLIPYLDALNELKFIELMILILHGSTSAYFDVRLISGDNVVLKPPPLRRQAGKLVIGCIMQ
jgi:hypothetical protein